MPPKSLEKEVWAFLPLPSYFADLLLILFPDVAVIKHRKLGRKSM
jgi:hypothetical protein